MALGLVPTNAIRAAAEGAIVPLLVFTVAFAFAASRTSATQRDPLVAVFRGIDAAITVLLQWIVACFVRRLHGVAIEPSRFVLIVLTAVVTSLAVGGVPSGAVVVVAPVLTAAGLPAEAIGLLLAIDPLPNAFRTVANVTGMMAVTVMAAGNRTSGGPPLSA